MAAFYIPERSQSVTIDLWPNVVWTEPREAAGAPSPALSQATLAPRQAMPNMAVQDRWRVTGHLPIFILPSPMIGPYYYLGPGAREAAALWVRFSSSLCWHLVADLPLWPGRMLAPVPPWPFVFLFFES